MTPLLLLAEKVEGLSGPDREVDCLIYAAVHIPADRAGKIDISAPYVGWHPVDGPYVSAIEAPRYTASVDSAMALVPEGWKLRQMHFNGPCADDRKWHLNLHGGRVGQDTFVGRGATPALALVAASLRARAAMEAGE